MREVRGFRVGTIGALYISAVLWPRELKGTATYLMTFLPIG